MTVEEALQDITKTGVTNLTVDEFLSNPSSYLNTQYLGPYQEVIVAAVQANDIWALSDAIEQASGVEDPFGLLEGGGDSGRPEIPPSEMGQTDDGAGTSKPTPGQGEESFPDEREYIPRLVYDPSTGLTKELPNIMGDNFVNIFRGLSPELIGQLQKEILSAIPFMDRENFDLESGQYGEVLEGFLYGVIDYANKTYLYDDEGNEIDLEKVLVQKKYSDLWDEANPDNEFYGMSPLSTKQKAQFYFFEKALEDFSKDAVAQKDWETRKAKKDFLGQLTMSMNIPSQTLIEETIEEMFEQRLGRKPTERELDIWATNNARKYSSLWQSYLDKVDMQDEENYYLDNIIKGGDVDMTPLLQPDTPEEIAAEVSKDFEEEYKTPIEARKTQQEISKQQSDTIRFIKLLGSGRYG
tara:strand:+ start:987 stop:2216 length:1230 start_codon:yes stop_codon:yes gene_type:complete